MTDRPLRPTPRALLVLLLGLHAVAILAMTPTRAPAAPSGEARNGASLKPILESVYRDWRQAMTTADLALWEETTAKHRRMEIRNGIVSKLQPFPDALFAVPMKPPALEHLKPLKTEEKNDTAVSVYYGKIDFGIASETIPDNLLVLHFARQPDGWKFDMLRYVRISEFEGVRNQIEQGELGFLAASDFSPLGVVPAAAEACPVPDLAAHVHIVSLGFQTRASINGIHSTEVRDNGMTDIVIGGLKDGINRIELDIKPLDLKAPADSESSSADGEAKPPPRRLTVSIYALRRAEKKPPVRVFHFEPKAAPYAHEALFEVRVADLLGK